MKADFLSIVFTAAIFIAVCKETYSLSFKQEPTGTGYYKRRDVVRLFCQLDQSNVDVIWYLNGNALQHHSTSPSSNSGKILRAGGGGFHQHLRSFIRRETANPNRTVHTDYIIERIANGSSLVFAPFRPQANAGVYHCAAVDQQSGITILSKSVILKKPVGPKQEFEEYMRSVEALSGNNVVLNCTQPVHAEPATYKWRYRKSQILEEFKDIDSEMSELPTGKAVTTPNGNLYLYNVTTQFAGDYRCVTVNELLEREAVTSYYYRLFVRNPKSLRNPVISHFSWFSSTQVEVGQSLTLECNADGAPRPTVAWRFSSFSSSSQQFGRPSQYKHKLHTQHEGILTISNASLEDSGIYACELEPAGSEFIKTVNVTVVPPLALQIFTHGTDEDGNLTNSLGLTVGESTSLRCTTNRPVSNTQMKVMWLRNGLPLSEETAGVHQEVYASGANLVISNAQLGDSGVYQCFLAEEQTSKSSMGGNNNAFGNNNAQRSPFGALVASNSVDYYQSVTGSVNNAASAAPQQQLLLIYNAHSDVFISVTWPLTTLDPPQKQEATTQVIITTASKPARVLSTPPSDELLIDAPVVSRVEKQSFGSVTVHWDHFKVPLSLRDAISGFSVEFCKIPQCSNNKWQPGAHVNATHRSVLVALIPEQQQHEFSSALPDASSFLFRVVATFRAPFFAATSGLLVGNATLQPLLIEPVVPPGDLKAMAIGSDQIAVVWADSAQLEALAPAVRDQLWYEVQWRPLGSNNGDSTNIYDVQHFSVRKPISSIKNAAQKIVPFVVLVDLSATTFYEIRIRYIRLYDTVGQVDAISPWSGAIHAETAIVDTPPLLEVHSLTPESLGVAVSSLFYPRMFDYSSTPFFSHGGEGFFGASSELLYTVLGIVMGCLVITLVVFVVLCALRQKRQRKYIQNMRRQLNRLPSKENLNRLLTPSQLGPPGSAQKMRPQFAAASPQGTSLSHQNHQNGSASNGHFNVPQNFQQQLGIFTGSALSSPTAVSAALAADISDNIIMSDQARFLNNDRPKLSMVNKSNAYGTMSRLGAGAPKLNGSAVGPVQSPNVAHNPYYRTLDSHRIFSNGGGLSQNKFNLMNGNGNGSKNGTPLHLIEAQQPLLSTAESAFVDPPYEMPSAVVAAAQQQRLILANKHALAGLGGPPLSVAAASSPANSVAQHYSTYSTFGRKNPLTTTVNNKLAGAVGNNNTSSNTNNSNLYFNDVCPDGVALAEMGVTANGIFISNNGAADSSSRSGVGMPASIKSSSTSPSATVTMQMGAITYSNSNSNNGINNNQTTPNGNLLQANGSLAGGGAQSTVSESVALSDQNGADDGPSNFTVDVSAPLSNGIGQRYSSTSSSRNVTAAGLGVTYRPPPQLSFLS